MPVIRVFLIALIAPMGTFFAAAQPASAPVRIRITPPGGAMSGCAVQPTADPLMFGTIRRTRWPWNTIGGWPDEVIHTVTMDDLTTPGTLTVDAGDKLAAVPSSASQKGKFWVQNIGGRADVFVALSGKPESVTTAATPPSARWATSLPFAFTWSYFDGVPEAGDHFTSLPPTSDVHHIPAGETVTFAFGGTITVDWPSGSSVNYMAWHGIYTATIKVTLGCYL